MVVLPYFVIGNSLSCVYCGSDAETKDHVIPVAQQTVNPNPKGRLTSFGPVAYCCSRCNTKLSDRYFETFDQRCQWISQVWNVRAKPVFWSNAQIEKLDHKLKMFIRQERDKRLGFRLRSDWYGSRDYLLSLEPLLWQKELDPSNRKASAVLIRYFHDTLNLLKLLYEKSDSSWD
jgi:hypothetical protein